MFKLKTVDAHCDVPCGIYETDTMMHAAATCLRMIEKIEELDKASDSFEVRNNFVRMVVTKEKHAERVKREVAVLWGDYFKPEHLEKFPELHDTVWKTLKQASKVKQTVSREEAQKLVDMVHELSHVFADSKA
jgi:nickel superoxide dismutase